jgi:hypothetical protein
VRGPEIPRQLPATTGPLPAVLSALRAGFGTVMIASPRTLPRGLGVDAATCSRVGWLVRMVGYREVALGAGTLLAARQGGGITPWLLGQALVDAGDAAAVATAWRRRQVATGPAIALIGLAVGGAATGVRSAVAAGRA